MFSSVLTSLKLQTEKLKESLNATTIINPEQIQNISTRLKANVIQTSSVLKTSVTQNIQGLFTTTASSFPASMTNNNGSLSKQKGSSNCDNFRGQTSRNAKNNRRRPHHRSRTDKQKTEQLPLLQSGNATWVELVEISTKTNKTRDKNSAKSGNKGRVASDEEVSTNSKSCSNNANEIDVLSNEDIVDFFSDDEDENVTQRFTRITGIGYRASKRRSDREEIRRRLALESDDLIEKPMGRKPSLHSRLQSKSVLPTAGMNLQICFMNETASDSESPNSDTESKNQQPASLPCVKAQSGGIAAFGGAANSSSADSTEDFQTKHTRLQTEARQALSQAKEMARLQMAQEKDQRLSPITEMLRNSLEKVGVQLQPERRRLTRQLLTEMNVAQLQVIVNDLHSHIEMLNETLVSLLLERDDLHMEQDSMLVDIEDLTRYLAAKDNSPHQSLPVISTRSYLGKK